MKNDRARRRRNLSPSRAVCETKKADVAGAKNIAKKALVLETPPPFGSRSHLLVRVRVGEAGALAHHGVRGGGGEPPRAPRLERVVLGVLVARRVVARQGAVVEHHSAIPSARTKRSPIRRSEARRADAAVGARDPRREPMRAFLEGRSWTTRSRRGARGATRRPRAGRGRERAARADVRTRRRYTHHTCSARQRTPKRCVTCGNGREGVRSVSSARRADGFDGFRVSKSAPV